MYIVQIVIQCKYRVPAVHFENLLSLKHIQLKKQSHSSYAPEKPNFWKYFSLFLENKCIFLQNNFFWLVTVK